MTCETCDSQATCSIYKRALSVIKGLVKLCAEPEQENMQVSSSAAIFDAIGTNCIQHRVSGKLSNVP